MDHQSMKICHLVALPYPGRGHINPMMNLCKLLVSRRPDVLITFVVTEEWLGFIGSATKPENIRVGKRRNIPVASLWTMSASVFSVFHYRELLDKKGHFSVELSERGNELVDYIPGLTSTRVADLPTILLGTGNEATRQILNWAIEGFSGVLNAQYLLFTSVYKLEAPVIDNLKAQFPFPVGLIPNLVAQSLYVSLGSFRSVSSAQRDEIVAGVRNSGVRYLWVSRGDTSGFEDVDDDAGTVVPWCDQLRVLCHSSIGGFWTHCGWNSTVEAVYAGVPMLTFPITMDQVPNSKQIVEDWKIGWRVKKQVQSDESLVTREEISEIVQRFMDLDNGERKEMKEKG
ncbi:hypothetical protein Patl1_31014 [Pistacia atlantica]|uniref:Uncharacterized protein n=1 Tax=Pistacia atlantica TaxID=434234 RepID=A0ACC1ADL7_9ROSI|nr:hypothetical protein Patl1_31014 [Pistacia atlantica]